MAYKNELAEVSLRELRARRRRLVAALPDVGETLRGTLARQGRRCGKEGCRCTRGELHGPYAYLSVTGEGGRSRMLYVPAGLAGAVARRVESTGRIEAALAEISAINLQLLVRRELD
jgi:hypothetical protein